MNLIDRSYTCILIILFISCGKQPATTFYHYGSEESLAVAHFNKGWEQILDYGQWTLSEASFRRAIEIDPNFLVGKSIVGKSTTNLNERLEIYEEVKQKIKQANQDEQLLLEITLMTLELFNARDQGKEIEAQFIDDFYKIGVSNYQEFVHRYPHESYMKAEYIEFLHAEYGPEQALDSLNLLVSKDQKDLPFFISYAAIMESEMGQYKKAMEKAKKLNEIIDDPDIPSPYVLYAQIYADMDSLSIAKEYIEKALELDRRHIIAQRLKKQLESKLNKL